ncbi:MAG: SHOCT domain-containing protein [Candidatus Nanopelagicales bacterium]
MDDSVNTFGSLFLTTLWIFLLFAFILVLFYIFSDIFRDHTMSGWAKAIWIIFLILLPPLTSLVYLIARGKGMQERALEQAQQAQKAQAEYIQQVAGTDPADQIAKAKQLLDQGVIDQGEYDHLKAKALGKA